MYIKQSSDVGQQMKK